MRRVRLLPRQFVPPLPEGCAMQPLLPMLVRDQWSATASTRPARTIPRRSETARVAELRPVTALRPSTPIAVLAAGA